VPTDRPALAKLLLEAGLVTRDVLESVNQTLVRDDRRLGSLLIERRLITAARLAQVISHQLSLPWVSLEKVEFSIKLLALVPKEIAYRYHVIPVYRRLALDGATLYVATDDPTREEGLRACEASARMRVRPMVAPPDQIREAIEVHYGRRRSSSSFRAVSAVEIVGSVRPAVDAVPPPRIEVPDAAPSAIEEPIDPPPEEVPTLPPPAPPPAKLQVVLLVSAPPALVELCRTIALGLPARVEATDLAAAARIAAEQKPMVIVVTDDVYAFDRLAFNKLAIEVRAPLVIWSDDLEAEYLEPVLATAFRSASSS
jgi:hypothetical protein